MKKPEYTNGPWEVATSCSWRRIVSVRMDGVCIPTVQRSDGHPDLVFPNGGSKGPDATLIAAAPDLAEALHTVMQKLDLGPEGNEPYMEAVMVKVRAALLKAGYQMEE